MVDTQALMSLADDGGRGAGGMFVAGVGSAPVLRKGHNDFATKVDLDIERLIRDRLAETGIPVVGEEQGGKFDPEACWVIDPVDGTANYAAGNPNCAILLSLIVDSQPVLAITDMPLLGMRMSTRDNGPVYLNGEQLPKLRDTSMLNAQVGMGSVGSPDSRRFPAEYRLKLIGWFSDTDLRPRITGSVGVDLAFVAQGVFKAAVSFSPNLWDNAAGVLLARNAGAVVTDGLGEEWSPTAPGVIAGTPAGHATVMRTINSIISK